MGNGIAHVCARAGYRVILFDVSREALERGIETISKNLDREVAKNKISMSDKSAAFSRILLTSEIESLREADFIIEAIVENIDSKLKVLKASDEIAHSSVVLASNTSSISITRMASGTQRPDRVIGMHFMNPVPVMTLVEVVRGQATSSETCQKTIELVKSLGKTPVEVNDYPGFVSNR